MGLLNCSLDVVLGYPVTKLTQQQLEMEIRAAGFPIERREPVMMLIWQGVEQFREQAVRRYYSHTGKSIKKPQPTHEASMGRHDQAPARTILISALCRSWMYGFDEAPTLNHRGGADSKFFSFASRIMILEGIGNPHKHLEEYWSVRKAAVRKNDEFLKNGDFPGGVF